MLEESGELYLETEETEDSESTGGDTSEEPNTDSPTDFTVSDTIYDIAVYEGGETIYGELGIPVMINDTPLSTEQGVQVEVANGELAEEIELLVTNAATGESETVLVDASHPTTSIIISTEEPMKYLNIKVKANTTGSYRSSVFSESSGMSNLTVQPVQVAASQYINDTSLHLRGATSVPVQSFLMRLVKADETILTEFISSDGQILSEAAIFADESFVAADIDHIELVVISEVDETSDKISIPSVGMRLDMLEIPLTV